MCDFGISQTLNLYTHAPVFFISVVMAYFVLMLDKKNPINRNLSFFILMFVFWVANDFLQWIIPYPKTSLLLGRIAILEAASMIFFLFFAYAFSGIELSIKRKLFFSLPITPIIALMFTNYNAYLT